MLSHSFWFGGQTRKWIAAIGTCALLSGVVLYIVTIVAVPVGYRGIPQVCLDGTGSIQECSDARARLALMEQLQPLAWFIAGLGVVLIILGLLFGESAIPPDLETRPS